MMFRALMCTALPCAALGLAMPAAAAAPAAPTATAPEDVRGYCASAGTALVAGAAAGHAVPGRGRYDNPVYGYALRVAPGLQTYANAEASQRGVTMRRADAPQAFIYVDARYDAFYDLTALAVQRRDLDRLRMQVQLLDPPRTRAAVLAGSTGARYTVTVRCPGDPAPYVEDDAIVVRKREIYHVHLHTPQARYAMDVRDFDATLDSWRWLGAANVKGAPSRTRPRR